MNDVQAIKYYACEDGQLFRLRPSDYTALIKGELKLQRFADRELRIIEVIIWGPDNPTARSFRGLIQHFTADGFLDVGEGTGAIELALRPKRLVDQGHNVLSLMPDIERKAWDKQHKWTIDPETAATIRDDLSKKNKLPTFLTTHP